MRKINYYIKPEGTTSLPEFVEFAKKNGYGLELSAFSDPNILDAPNLKDIIKEYKEILKGFPHLMLHGIFADMYPVSRDKKVVELCRERMTHCIDIAGELKAEGVVFHTNYIPLVGNYYFEINGGSWEDKQTDFWKTLIPVAEKNGVVIYLENLWETKPELIKTICDNIGSKYIHSCFDAGHANVYSDVLMKKWMDILGKSADYYHISDNFGDKYVDEHKVIGEGTIDWRKFLEQALSQNSNPRICIEVYALELTKKSLEYLIALEKSICDG